MPLFEIWRKHPKDGEAIYSTQNTRRSAEIFIRNSETLSDRYFGVTFYIREIPTDMEKIKLAEMPQELYNKELKKRRNTEKKRRQRANKREKSGRPEYLNRFNPEYTAEKQAELEAEKEKAELRKLQQTPFPVFSVEQLDLMMEYCRFSRKEYERMYKFSKGKINLMENIALSNSIVENIELSLRIHDAREEMQEINEEMKTGIANALANWNKEEKEEEEEISESDIMDALANWRNEPNGN